MTPDELTPREREVAASAWEQCRRAEMSWRWAVTCNQLGMSGPPPHPPKNPYI